MGLPSLMNDLANSTEKPKPNTEMKRFETIDNLLLNDAI
jgi:hypothetical protein